MKGILTLQERKQLLNRHKKERDGRIRDRIKAVLAYDEGYTPAEISKILLLDDKTIRRHIDDYLKAQKLSPRNGGRQSKLSKSETVELINHLQKKTYLYVKDICAYVKKRFGKTYSISGMTKWLQATGFRYKKPHGVPAKSDKRQQEAFVEYYNELKKTTRNKAPIYFADSIHPQHQTHLAYGWIYKGVRKAIAMTGRQKRLNFMGGICLDGHKIVVQKSDKVDGNSIIRFLKKLRKKHPDKEQTIHLIWDNAGYHRSKDVRAYAKEHSIKIHYLPPYSPNLNPIERLWKIMHEQVSYNKYYDTFAAFTQSMLHFFRHIGKQKKLLKRRITDNFQIINTPTLAS